MKKCYDERNNICGKKIGFCITGSFCTLNRIPAVLEKLVECGAEVMPIMSEIVMSTDTRFTKAREYIALVEEICHKKVISSVVQSEPIGPKNLLDGIVVAPCTGNTLAKIAYGITDNTVTMACKANLRNGNPLVLAVSTNDALSANAKNIGTLMNVKNIFFVPFGQDDCGGKPTSMVADMSRVCDTLECALGGEQIQPMLIEWEQKGKDEEKK